MANLKYDKEITALLLIDPYNDFISEGGKVWNRLKTGLIAHPCVEATVRYAAELGYEVTMVKDRPRTTWMRECTLLSTSISLTTPLPCEQQMKSSIRSLLSQP